MHLATFGCSHRWSRNAIGFSHNSPWIDWRPFATFSVRHTRRASQVSNVTSGAFQIRGKIAPSFVWPCPAHRACGLLGVGGVAQHASLPRPRGQRAKRADFAHRTNEVACEFKTKSGRDHSRPLDLFPIIGEARLVEPVAAYRDFKSCLSRILAGP